MEDLPLHPKLVHLPMALAALMPLLAGGLLLAWWRGWLPKRTWTLTVAAQSVLLVSGLFSMRTGETDEERVERVVPKNAIERHEEAAEAFVWGSGIVLALALLPLLLRRPKRAEITGLATVAGTVVVLFLGIRVGEEGGELVYRHNAGAAFAGASTPQPGAKHAPAREDHDDDENKGRGRDHR